MALSASAIEGNAWRLPMLLRDTAVAIIVGATLLFALSSLVGRVQFSLGTAFWCSFIGHILVTVISLLTGFVFSRKLAVGLIISLSVGWILQAVVLQLAVRAKSGNLVTWRAFTLSLIVILGDFFVASPLIELWEHLKR